MMQLKSMLFLFAISGITGFGLRPYGSEALTQASPQRNVLLGANLADPTPPALAKTRSVVPLSGSADSPCQAKPGSMLNYIVRSVGQFITPANGGKPHNVDVTTRARPVLLRSIEPGSLKVLTTTLPSGERVYRVSGTARTEPGVYMDTWMSYNTPRNRTIQPATPLLFVEMIVIMTDPGPHAGDNYPPLADKLEWRQEASGLRALARTIHPAPRDRAAARLQPRLIELFSNAQRLELKQGKEVGISVTSLPTELRREAENYIDVACRKIDGRPTIQFDSRQPMQYDMYKLMILPGQDHQIGINCVSMPHGMGTYF